MNFAMTMTINATLGSKGGKALMIVLDAGSLSPHDRPWIDLTETVHHFWVHHFASQVPRARENFHELGVLAREN